jgi:hypothetical protein
MCSNFADSVKAASRGEDFLNPCQDSNLLCKACVGTDSMPILDTQPKSEELLLDFLSDVKPKKKPAKVLPKLEIDVDAGGTGGGWGDEEFDI